MARQGGTGGKGHRVHWFSCPVGEYVVLCPGTDVAIKDVAVCQCSESGAHILGGELQRPDFYDALCNSARCLGGETDSLIYGGGLKDGESSYREF